MERFPFYSVFCFYLLLVFHVYGGSRGERLLEDSSKDTLSKHQVGLGLHMMPQWRIIQTPIMEYNDCPLKTSENLIFQGTYKYSLENLKVRAGIAWGKMIGWEESRYWLFNIGGEKDIWKPGKAYRLGVALDFLFGMRQRSVIQLPPANGPYPTIVQNWFGGGGISLVNTFHLSAKGSISLEFGISGNKTKSCTYYENRGKECQWFPWALPLRNFYRQAVLSYHYRF